MQSSKPKISVVGVTNRQGGAQSIVEALQFQTFKDYELIIADDSLDGFFDGSNIFKPRQKVEGDVYNLNKAYNDCLDKAQGELIVSLQDFIRIPANGLERFWELYQMFPNDLVTGCGHKYVDGKIAETDDRCFGEKKLVETDWSFFELNWASIPAHLGLRFDEDMDKCYAGSEKLMAKAAYEKGSIIWLDRTNECKGDAHFDRPADWEDKHANKGYLNKKINDI